jgi:archaeal flagellin FlaB
MNSMKPNDEGFTGLEAAIVLIAFVVVAAVFSYVVLGAGFFTTQKSQEVVHTGVQQASSTLQIVGNVYGIGTAGNPVHYINFTVALAPGGTPVDISKMVITYSNNSALETLSLVGTEANIGTMPGWGQWNVMAVRNGAATNLLLEKGEQFDVTAYPSNGLPADSSFNLELKPITGAALDIKRTIPPGTKVLNILY